MKIQFLDFLVKKNAEYKEKSLIPTLDLLIEELEEEVELASKLASAEMQSCRRCFGTGMVRDSQTLPGNEHPCDECEAKALAVTA